MAIYFEHTYDLCEIIIITINNNIANNNNKLSLSNNSLALGEELGLAGILEGLPGILGSCRDGFRAGMGFPVTGNC